MPLYEYECDACGHRFERIQKFSDALVSACPECDGAVRKLLSSPAIQFKGTGWYVTDYAQQKKPADEQAAANGKDAAKSKDDAKSKADSKSSSSAPPATDAKGAAGSKTKSPSSSASPATS